MQSTKTVHSEAYDLQNMSNHFQEMLQIKNYQKEEAGRMCAQAVQSTVMKEPNGGSSAQPQPAKIDEGGYEGHRRQLENTPMQVNQALAEANRASCFPGRTG